VTTQTPKSVANTITQLPIDAAYKQLQIEVEPGAIHNQVYEIAALLESLDSAYRIVDFEVNRPIGHAVHTYTLTLRLVGIAELGGVLTPITTT
jgi:hypothetical protein